MTRQLFAVILLGLITFLNVVSLVTSSPVDKYNDHKCHYSNNDGVPSVITAFYPLKGAAENFDIERSWGWRWVWRLIAALTFVGSVFGCFICFAAIVHRSAVAFIIGAIMAVAGGYLTNRALDQIPLSTHADSENVIIRSKVTNAHSI